MIEEPEIIELFYLNQFETRFTIRRMNDCDRWLLPKLPQCKFYFCLAIIPHSSQNTHNNRFRID